MLRALRQCISNESVRQREREKGKAKWEEGGRARERERGEKTPMLSVTKANDTGGAVVTAARRRARAEIVASAPGLAFFTWQKLPAIALHIVITSDTIVRVITRYEERGHSLEHNLSASNLARGRFVYRLSDDMFRRY